MLEGYARTLYRTAFTSTDRSRDPPIRKPDYAQFHKDLEVVVVSEIDRKSRRKIFEFDESRLVASKSAAEHGIRSNQRQCLTPKGGAFKRGLLAAGLKASTLPLVVFQKSG